MENHSSNQDFWSDLYFACKTPWDIGSISTPLKEYFDQLENKEIRILIPGAGNAYEAEYLHKQGFPNVHIADISEVPLVKFKKRVPSFPEEMIIHDDFFNLTHKFDLIIEQTFFCSLHPSQRGIYVNKIWELLEIKGKLVGVLFQFPLIEQGPPFGGDKSTYFRLFRDRFEVIRMEESYNSIKPRSGSELFINLIKREDY